MAGSNFIGVNLCFATGYGQTYIVDPLSNTYNVGDYVSINGNGGYLAVKLTASTASAASYSGTGTPYATFLEALQEANRIAGGYNTDYCVARLSGAGIGNNCGPQYNKSIGWSYTAATAQTGFNFYTSGGLEPFYPVEYGVVDNTTYKLGFSGSGFTNDCYPLVDIVQTNLNVPPTIQITGASIAQKSFTNCSECESGMYLAKGCCFGDEIYIQTSGLTFPAYPGMIIPVNGSCYELISSYGGTPGSYAIASNYYDAGNCTQCLVDYYSGSTTYSGTPWCFATLKGSDVSGTCASNLSTIIRFPYTGTTEYTNVPFSSWGQNYPYIGLTTSPTFKLVSTGLTNFNYCYFYHQLHTTAATTYVLSDFEGYSNCATCRSSLLTGSYFAAEECCSENLITPAVSATCNQVVYVPPGVSAGVGDVINSVQLATNYSGKSFTLLSSVTPNYSSSTILVDSVYTSCAEARLAVSNDGIPWCYGKFNDACETIAPWSADPLYNYVRWDYTATTYSESGDTSNPFRPNSIDNCSTYKSSYAISFSGYPYEKNCYKFSYTVGYANFTSTITAATLVNTIATSPLCVGCTATTWLAESCCIGGDTFRIDVSLLDEPFGEGSYVKTDAGCFRLLKDNGTSSPSYTASTATSALTYYVYSSCTECLEEYNRIYFPALPLQSCISEIYAVTCDASTYGPYDIYWDYNALGVFSGTGFNDIYPLPALYDCWKAPLIQNTYSSPSEILYFTSYNDCATCTGNSISYSAVSCCDPCDIVYIDGSSVEPVYVDDVLSDGNGCWKVLGISNVSPTISATTNYGADCETCVSTVNDGEKCQVKLCACGDNKCENSKYYFRYNPEQKFCFTGNAFSLLTDDGFRFSHYLDGDICFSSATVVWGTAPETLLSNILGTESYPDCTRCNNRLYFSAVSCCDLSRVEIVEVTDYFNPVEGIVVTDYNNGNTYGAWTLTGSPIYTAPQPALFFAYWEASFAYNDFTDCVLALSWYNNLLGYGTNSWCLGSLGDCDEGNYNNYYFYITQLYLK